MKLRKKKLSTYQSLISALKREWKSLPPELTIKLVHSMNNRISEVMETLYYVNDHTVREAVT